jgi:EAL domain-containing protein (putative c-di-GMP-specific phosphodiesterase class I)
LPAWQIVLVTLLAANCALVGVVATGPLRGALRRAGAAGSAPALAAVGVLAALALADAAGPRVGLNRTVAGLAAVGLLLVVVLFSRGRRRMRQLDQLLEMPLTEPVPVDARRLEPATTSRVTAIAERTRAVLEARQMEMALQPIIDLNTGAWVSAEALARFPDARQPNEWISEAYEAGLGPDLELQAVETALATAAHLPEDVRLAVNVSPAMTLDPRFIERITACGLALDRIILEITEHTTVSHYPSIERALSPLRANGLALAVDDAGAGYASFAHVLQLRPEIIKLDRSLTLGIDHEPAARAFVTGVMLLALELRAAVVAEGVETGEELATLETLGIDFAQGYLLAMPSMNPHDWQAWPDRTWDVGQITPEPTPVRASSPGTIRLTASTPTVHV